MTETGALLEISTTPDPRLGLIVPSVNRVVEVEWASAWPQTIPVHIARARYVYGPTALEGLCNDSLRAAEDLAPAKPSFGIFACTGGSFFRGSSGNVELARELTERMGCEVITASTAVARALRRVGAKSVAVVTPYAQIDVDRAAHFLSDQGFEVPHASGMGIADASLESYVKPKQVLDFAIEQLRGVTADAVLVSCTNLQSLEIVPELERHVGRVVITSNQATLAAAIDAFRLAPPSPERFGALFRYPPAA